MAIPLPKHQMAPRSSSQVRAGGTQRRTLLRAAVTIPSRAPQERSKQRDHGELLTSDRLSNSVVGGAGTGFQRERLARTTWIVFLLRVSDAQSEPRELRRRHPGGLVSYAPSP